MATFFGLNRNPPIIFSCIAIIMQRFPRPSVLNTVEKIHSSITNLSDDILVKLLLYGSKNFSLKTVTYSQLQLH